MEHKSRITQHKTYIMGQEGGKNSFHQKLRDKMNVLVHLVYKLTRRFPKEEIYGTTSQLRRAALSVILNYIEGYSRMRPGVYKNFLEISYGSLQETKYLLDFSLEEGYLADMEHEQVSTLANEIGAMLWSVHKNIKQ